MNTESVGQRLKRLREQLRYSKAQLARSVGVSHVAVLHWENDANSIKGKYLTRLAEIFGVYEAYILYGNEAAKARDGSHGLLHRLEEYPDLTEERLEQLLLEIYRPLDTAGKRALLRSLAVIIDYLHRPSP